MGLQERVRVVRRFQRSIRIDTDLHDNDSLRGFVCPKSSAEVLSNMARHALETKHTAFTWTGPYGSGKSSLVVALGALLGADKALQSAARSSVGPVVADRIAKAFPAGKRGWTVVPVVGRREAPARVIGEALEDSGVLQRRRREWGDDDVIKTLAEHVKSHSPVILFVDEMGKFLEGAAQYGSDIYIFQQLAELAVRSEGALVFVGILHQAFEEYAHRLSREMRDEWAKIQGRFVDLPVNMAGEEQVELLARAIESDRTFRKPGPIADAVAEEIRRSRPAVAPDFSERLEECWPLHPVVACLLGPISRRRFGQNQRSVFGFLNSVEAFGFQEFLSRADDGVLFTPDRLWDYLRANLEPSIMASPDGHRWAVAVEAVERCEGLGGEEIHLQLLKTIALIDLFKERSGLLPRISVLESAYPAYTNKAIQRAVDQLAKWSFIAFRKFVDAYAMYAGSDFDIEQALQDALEAVHEIDFTTLHKLAGIQPILAKRHYHTTGTLRWFDVSFAPLDEVHDFVSGYEPADGTIGLFLLAIPTQGETEELASRICREAARGASTADVVVGLSHRGWVITDLARELIALEAVRDERPELAGDAVARREITSRLAALQGHLEMELQSALDSATWYQKYHSANKWLHAELNSLASNLADKRFSEAPRIHNEMLNRMKPSSNAIAAQNKLLQLMVRNEGQPRLGIDGFPAEGGLFASLLESTGLYAETNEGWRFAAPGGVCEDSRNLAPAWHAAREYLQANADRTVPLSEIYGIWRSPPFGIKDGLMPVLAVAFILSGRESVAFYRLGIFQARFRDLDTEYLARDAEEVQLRWMDLSDISRRLLSGMADVVRELDGSNSLSNLTPIDVARGLIAIHDNLRPWVKRTNRLSSNASRIRALFKFANDPNKLLFDDIPAGLSIFGNGAGEPDLQAVVGEIRDGLRELQLAYPSMLQRLSDSVLAELQVPNSSPQALSELRARAENVRQLAGDFQLDAFVGRLAQFQGTEENIEGLASLAANKPTRDWVDPDLDRAAMELADLAQRFLRAETFARVKGRKDKRHALAIMVGMNGRPAPLVQEFELADADREQVEQLARQLLDTLHGGNLDRNVLLAALAEASAAVISSATPPRAAKRRKLGTAV
ncbi:MAG: ATP-binding protein [Mesorhizobium sp.]